MDSCHHSHSRGDTCYYISWTWYGWSWFFPANFLIISAAINPSDSGPCDNATHCPMALMRCGGTGFAQRYHRKLTERAWLLCPQAQSNASQVASSPVKECTANCFPQGGSGSGAAVCIHSSLESRMFLDSVTLAEGHIFFHLFFCCEYHTQQQQPLTRNNRQLLLEFLSLINWSCWVILPISERL